MSNLKNFLKERGREKEIADIVNSVLFKEHNGAIKLERSASRGNVKRGDSFIVLEDRVTSSL